MKNLLKKFFCVFIFFSIVFAEPFALSVIGTSMLIESESEKDAAQLYSQEIRSTFAGGKAVNVVDSVRISSSRQENATIYAEWLKTNPSETREFSKVISGQAVWFSFEWSIKDTDDVKGGDYFTVVFPDVLDHSRIVTKSGELFLEDGTLIGTYVISVNAEGKKQITITFTDAVETHEEISGSYGLAIYVIEFENGEKKPFEFELNGNVIIGGNVTGGTPVSGTYRDTKSGSYVERSNVIDGYYYFFWRVYVNFAFDTINEFTFEDLLPAGSPHQFITPNTLAELGITSLPSNKQYLYNVVVKEYTAADDFPLQADRYNQFQSNLNNGSGWYNGYETYTFKNGISPNTPKEAIGGGVGIILNPLSIESKSMKGNLGKVTRPVIIEYYTIATVKFNEIALGDTDIVNQIQNTFKYSGGTQLSSHAYELWLTEEITVTGIKGDYSFNFKKTDENGNGLEGAGFSLYTTQDLEGGAYKYSTSNSDGTVIFKDIKAGTYYIKETAAPDGYIISDTIYKVVLVNDLNFTIAILDSEGNAGGYVTEIMNFKKEETTTSETTTSETTTSATTTSETTTSETTTSATTTSETTTSETTTSATTTSETTTSATTTSETTTSATTTSATTTSANRIPEEYVIVQYDDNIYIIYDPEGVPLGYLVIPEGGSLEELTLDDIIPLGMLELKELPVTGGTTTLVAGIAGIGFFTVGILILIFPGNLKKKRRK